MYKKQFGDLYNHLGIFTKASYKPQKEASQDLAQHGYSYDPDLSTMETKVFSKGGVPTIVHRGSTTVRDWADNALHGIGLGMYSKRLNEAKRITKAVEQKYGTGANAIGHSRGGFLSENSGAHGQILTLNKATSPFDIFKKKNENRQLDVRVQGDLPSLLSKTQRHNVETIPNYYSTSNPITNAFNAHKTDNIFSHLHSFV